MSAASRPKSIASTRRSKVTAAPRRKVLPALTPPAPPVRTEAEQEFVRDFATKMVARGPRRPPAMVEDVTESGQRFAKPNGTKDPHLWRAQLGAATGSAHQEGQSQLFFELAMVCGARRGNEVEGMEGALAHMLDIAPRDGVEGMLASQMVATHAVAMTFLATGTTGGQSLEMADFRLKHAERLMRLYGLQLDALSRYRGKGPSEQKVTVEHVHVHEGGQAVVGNVSAPAKAAPGGGG